MKHLLKHRAVALLKRVGLPGRPKLAKVYAAQDLRGSDVTPLEAYHAHGGQPCVVDVPLAECRWFGASGLSYDIESLHPYVRTLADYEAGRCTGYDGSFLERFWQAWQPANLAEYLRLDPGACHPALLDIPPVHNILPWSAEDRLAIIRSRRWVDQSRKLGPEGYPPARSCGPKPKWFGEQRVEHLLTIFERLRQEGYRHSPSQHLSYGKQHIVGTCLVSGGEARYLVADGQHRAASLAVLGYREVPMIVHCPMKRAKPSVVRLAEVRNWPLVRTGLFSVDDASRVFRTVFDAIPPEQVLAMGSSW